MKYLVVCTGNTCRSPMAESILRSRLAAEDEVRSAGVAASANMPRSRHAVTALAEIGGRLTGTATPLDERLVRWADLILVMEPHHREAILMRFKPDPDKVRLLSDWADPNGRKGVAGDAVSDPYGGTLDDYRAVRDELMTLIRMGLDD